MTGGIVGALRKTAEPFFTIHRLIFHYPKLVLSDDDYDTYWRRRRQKGQSMGTINSFQKHRAGWVLPRIEDGASILDIGSGDGGVLLYLMASKPLKPTATDVSPMAIEFLQSKGIHTLRFDFARPEAVEELPRVDHVILFEVLEHMQNPEKFLRLMESKARKSIFFSVPNTGYIPYRVRMLLGSFVMQWRAHPGEHVRFWTFQDLKWWLRELGYESRTEIHVYEGIPVLNKIWRGLFGMAFVGEIRCG